MTATLNTIGNGAGVSYAITGVASTAGGGIASIANPEGVDLHILATYWEIKTPSTGGANIDIGIGTAAADSTDIINALADSSAGVFNGIAQVVTAKSAAGLKWASGSVLNITGSATTVGLEAVLHVQYIRLA